MKNILNEKPNKKIVSRLKFTTHFVDNKDLAHKKILDIGCGYGWFELNALKRDAKEIHGVEITEEDLKTVKENITDKRAEFKIGGALKLPYKDNYFDTVVSWEVIEHIPKNTEAKMFKEVSRVLKRNGIFYLSTPYDSFRSRTFDPAFWLVGHRHYSKSALIDLGKKTGLEIKDVQIRGGTWNLIGLLNMYFSKWILRRVPLFEKQLKPREDKEYKNREGFMGIFVKYKRNDIF